LRAMAGITRWQRPKRRVMRSQSVKACHAEAGIGSIGTRCATHAAGYRTTSRAHPCLLPASRRRNAVPGFCRRAAKVEAAARRGSNPLLAPPENRRTTDLIGLCKFPPQFARHVSPATTRPLASSAASHASPASTRPRGVPMPRQTASTVGRAGSALPRAEALRIIAKLAARARTHTRYTTMRQAPASRATRGGTTTRPGRPLRPIASRAPWAGTPRTRATPPPALAPWRRQSCHQAATVVTSSTRTMMVTMTTSPAQQMHAWLDARQSTQAQRASTSKAHSVDAQQRQWERAQSSQTEITWPI
jgi:hypothetical protein